MIPKTAREREVDNLSKQLRPIDWEYIDKCIAKQAERTAFSYPKKKGYTCGICGTAFEKKYKSCPHCRAKFENYLEMKGYTENLIEGQIDRVGQWMIERLVRIKIFHSRGKGQAVQVREVLQRWVPYQAFADGSVEDRGLRKAVFRATPREFMTGDLSMYGVLEIRRPFRRNDFVIAGCYDYTPLSGYLWKFRIPSELRRRGLTPKIDEPIYYSHLLMNYPHFETLVKTNCSKLTRQFLGINGMDRLDKLWPSLKIALRGGLIDKECYGNVSEFLDYLDMVVEGMPENNRNLTVVLPNDFKNSFEIARRRAELARNRAEIIKCNKTLKRTRESLSNRLKIANGNLLVVVLTSVEQFIHEGRTLHHCVYANKYYKKSESLILSARKIDDPNTPVETIEIRLDDNFRIAQCYGDHNHPSLYHDEILQLVNSAIPQIRKAIKSTEAITPSLAI